MRKYIKEISCPDINIILEGKSFKSAKSIFCTLENNLHNKMLHAVMIDDEPDGIANLSFYLRKIDDINILRTLSDAEAAFLGSNVSSMILLSSFLSSSKRRLPKPLPNKSHFPMTY